MHRIEDDNDTQCFCFPIDDLMKDEGFVTGSGCNLENDIHPLFARHNMHGFDYDAILPALRLASYFLTTECLMDYWYAALLDEGREQTREEKPDCNCKILTSEGVPIHYSLTIPKRKLVAKELAVVRLNMLNMAHIVHFYTKDVAACGCCLGGEGVIRPGVFHNLEGFGGGIMSDVLMGVTYKTLMLCHKASNCDSHNVSDELLHRYFEFAVTLVHELAHTTNNARFGPIRGIAFDDRNMAEAGFDWEATVFGGLPAVAGGGQMTMEEWPSATIYESHRVLHGEDVLQLCGQLTEKTSRRWRIPNSWIRQLFQRAFWEEVIPAKGAGALHPPKVLGYRYICQECECSACLEKSRADGHVVDSRSEPSSTDQQQQDSFQQDSSCEATAIEKEGQAAGLAETEDPEYCFAGVASFWQPLPWDVDFGLYEGVPEGYVMLIDGTLVLESLQGQLKQVPVLSKDAKEW